MKKQTTISQVFDTNKRTGALILGVDRLDDYATKFLSQYCKEAIEKPMPLPVEDIISKANLTIETASLSKDLDVFGCCMLLDGFVDIYDAQSNAYHSKYYKAGTLLFDPASEWAYGEGSKRNTLVHELLHWEKDRTYFKILELKNKKVKEKLYPIMCRQSRTNFFPPNGNNTKQSEIQWLEWQAHKLTPRVLMPRIAFKKKAIEFIDAGLNSCDEIVHLLADFFIVSRISVKIRLLEVGLEGTISQFNDFSDVFADLNRTENFVPLLLEDSLTLLNENAVFEEWVQSRGFVFVDGYFVLADKKYVSISHNKAKLTKYARNNLSQCAINIQALHFINYKYCNEDYNGYACLYKTGPSEVDKRILAFNPRLQAELNKGIDDKDVTAAFKAAKDNLIPYDENTEKELLRMIGDEDKTLCDCLWFLIQTKGWTDGLDFYLNTKVHENYFARIRDNKDSANNMKSDTLWAICVGLGLRLRLTEKIFGKSERKLRYYEDPDKTRIRIMETYPCINIDDYNSLLIASKLAPLGTVERKK